MWQLIAQIIILLHHLNVCWSVEMMTNDDENAKRGKNKEERNLPLNFVARHNRSH